MSDSQETGNPDFPRVFVHSSVDGSLLRQFSGEVVDEIFGYGLAIELDLDGDGWDDIAVGAPLAGQSGNQYDGEVRVFSGKTGTLLFEQRGSYGDDFAGYVFQVIGLDDLNGDGMDELLTSSPYLDGAQVDAVYVDVITPSPPSTPPGRTTGRGGRGRTASPSSGRTRRQCSAPRSRSRSRTPRESTASPSSSAAEPSR